MRADFEKSFRAFVYLNERNKIKNRPAKIRSAERRIARFIEKVRRKFQQRFGQAPQRGE